SSRIKLQASEPTISKRAVSMLATTRTSRPSNGKSLTPRPGELLSRKLLFSADPRTQTQRLFSSCGSRGPQGVARGVGFYAGVHNGPASSQQSSASRTEVDYFRFRTDSQHLIREEATSVPPIQARKRKNISVGEC